MDSKETPSRMREKGKEWEKSIIDIRCLEPSLVTEALHKLSYSKTWCRQTKFYEICILPKPDCASTAVITTRSCVHHSWSRFQGKATVSTSNFEELVSSLAREIRRLMFLERLAELASRRLFKFVVAKRRRKIEYIARRFEVDVAVELYLDKELIAEAWAYLWVFPNHLISHSQKEWIYTMRRYVAVQE